MLKTTDLFLSIKNYLLLLPYSMKILFAHNRYQLAGGEDVVVQSEAALLESNGHEVLGLEVNNDDIVGGWSKAKAAVSAIYSTDSRNLLNAEIKRFHPDIVHIHNFFPLLSPAVYDACRNAGVPVVQTLHNYRLGCPKAMLFRDSQVCEDCIGKLVPWPSIMHGCYRSSRTQSAVVTAMITLHRLRNTWKERVDAYITLTNFQKEKMIQTGLPEEKIYVKPNFIVDPGSLVKTGGTEEYALFVGRLSEEKGVSTLIDAYVQLHEICLPLNIVGDGPLRSSLQERVQVAGLESTVKFLGQQNKSAVLTLMHNAKFLVFPSIWYEGFPLTLVEAFACSLSVIVPRLGSMAEIVEDGVTGLFFEAGNAEDLAEKLLWAKNHSQKMLVMGKNARDRYEAHYTAEANYQQLIAIYQQVISSTLSKASCPSEL